MQQWGVEEGVSAATLTSRKHLSLSDLLTDLGQQPDPPDFSAASLIDVQQVCKMSQSAYFTDGPAADMSVVELWQSKRIPSLGTTSPEPCCP